MRVILYGHGFLFFHRGQHLSLSMDRFLDILGLLYILRGDGRTTIIQFIYGCVYGFRFLLYFGSLFDPRMNNSFVL